MSYGRDPDAATRGPGAIAALDRAGGRRARRKATAARASAQRDRAMAAISRGALGRIDLRTAGEPSGGGWVPLRNASFVKVAPAIPTSPVANPMAPTFLTTGGAYDVLPPPPVPPPAPTPKPGVATTVSVNPVARTITGTSTSVLTTVAPKVIASTPPTPLPDVESADSSSSADSSKMWLIGAGAGVLALLWLGRKGR